MHVADDAAEVTALRAQVEELARSLQQLRETVAEQSRTIAELTATLASSPETRREQLVAAAAPPKPTEKSVSPEILVVITAAVTAFLGKKVRIRLARALQSPYELMNPWAQQGRVSVMASHMLRRAG